MWNSNRQYEELSINGTLSAVAVSAALIAAPGASKKIVVDRLIFSPAAAATNFKGNLCGPAGTPVTGPIINCGANNPYDSGVAANFMHAANTALHIDVKVLTAGDVDYYIEYHVEG